MASNLVLSAKLNFSFTEDAEAWFSASSTVEQHHEALPGNKHGRAPEGPRLPHGQAFHLQSFFEDHEDDHTTFTKGDAGKGREGVTFSCVTFKPGSAV